MPPNKILPPPQLSPRVVPRSEPHVAVEDSRRSAIHAETIRWKDLVLAAWQLSADEQYTGELPPGLSGAQFWTKVRRAAKQLGAGEVPRWMERGEFRERYAGMDVGVAVRGRRWWVWKVERT